MLDLKQFRKANKLTQIDLANILDVTQAYISLVEKGKNKLSDELIYKLKERGFDIGVYEVNADNGEKDRMLLIEEPELHLHTYASHVPVKVVTTKARAGFAGAYYADEYLNDMPTVLMEADKEHRGKYLAFEVDGDSMEPEYIEGDIVICREVKRDLWQYKLHIKEWDFVIAHGTKGIMLKEIIDHNVETGEIVCHSVNTEEHPDFTLNLREVAYLYNVVEVRRSGRTKRRNRK